MNVNKANVFWGVILVAGGGLALAQQMGYVDQLSPAVGIFSFTAISVAALIMYAMSGWKEWG